jgi:hypothetical protein
MRLYESKSNESSGFCLPPRFLGFKFCPALLILRVVRTLSQQTTNTLFWPRPSINTMGGRFKSFPSSVAVPAPPYTALIWRSLSWNCKLRLATCDFEGWNLRLLWQVWLERQYLNQYSRRNIGVTRPNPYSTWLLYEQNIRSGDYSGVWSFFGATTNSVDLGPRVGRLDPKKIKSYGIFDPFGILLFFHGQDSVLNY